MLIATLFLTIAKFQGTIEVTCSKILIVDSIGQKIYEVVDLDHLKKTMTSSPRVVRPQNVEICYISRQM